MKSIPSFSQVPVNMSRILCQGWHLCGLSLLVLSLHTAPAMAQEEETPDPLSSVCATIDVIEPGDLLIKSEASAHFSNPLDRRTTGYTLVCARRCPSLRRTTLPFYFANGTLAGELARYLPNFSGNGRPRFYGGTGRAPQHFARRLARQARRIAEGGSLYLQMSRVAAGPRTRCVEFAPSGRNGSL